MVNAQSSRIEQNIPIISNITNPFQWTQKALNYRIPRRGANYTLFSIAIDSLIAVSAPLILDAVLNSPSATLPFATESFWIIMLAIVLTRVVTFNALGLYSSSQQPRFIAEVAMVSIGLIASFLNLLGIFYLSNTIVTLDWVLFQVGATLLVHLGWRTVAYFWSYYSSVRRILAPHRVLIIGATELGRELENIIHHFPLPTARVVGYLDNNLTGMFNDSPIIGSLDDDIFKIIREHSIDEIILTTTRDVSRKNSSAILNLQYVPLPVWLVPNYLKLNLYSVAANSISQLPLVSLRQTSLASHERLIKRALDVAVSGLALLLNFPVMSLIALAIWLNDRGPIFFKQDRYGENGKVFRMLKFRSMVVNADKMVDEVKITDDDGKTIYKRQNDPRITPIGRFIRKTSLDELPQLINILRGEMSIVGPRPEVRKIVENEYQPWQYERLCVPQGLTGWWQVNGRSEKECYTDTEKDIYYVKNYSVWLDIKIILMTIPALLKGKGAY